MIYFGSINDMTEKNIIIKGRIKAEYIGCGENSIKVKFSQQEVDYTSAVAFAILDSENRFLWYSPTDINSDSVEINLEGFDYLAPGEVPLRYKLYVVFESDEDLTFSRLFSKPVKDQYRETEDRHLLYYDTISTNYFEDKKVNLIVNITTSGYFGFILINQSSKFNYLFSNFVEAFDIVQNEFCFAVSMNKLPSCNKFGLALKSKMLSETFYDIDSYAVQDLGDNYLLKCRLSRRFFDLEQPDSLNLCSYYEIDGFRYYVSVRMATQELAVEVKQLAIKDNNKKGISLMDFTFRSFRGKLRFPSVLPVGGVEITGENTPQRILFAPDFLAQRVMFGTHRVEPDGRYIVTLMADVREIKDVSAFVHNSRRKEKIIVDVTDFDPETGDITIDFSAMKDSIQDFKSRAYQVCIAFSYKGYMYAAKIKSPDYVGDDEDEEPPNIDERLQPAIASFKIKDSVVVLNPFYDVHGRIFLRVRDRLLAQKEFFSVKYEKLQFKNNFLYISADVTDINERFTGFALSYRYKLSEDKRVYFAKGELVAKGKKTLLKAKFDLSKLELHRIIWDIFAVYQQEDASYFTSIVLTDKQIDDYLFSFKNYFRNNDYRVETEQGRDVFFPYFTTINSVAFMMREENTHDSRKFKLKEFVSMVTYKLFKRILHRKRIILIYEKFCNCAQDNGYCFFKYCMEHNVEKRLNAKIYYLIDKKSSDYNRVKMYDKNVIDFLSVKHMVYMLASRLLVSSDSRPHSYAWRPNNSAIERYIKGKKIFFLQHGVIALKRIDELFSKSKSNAFDRFVASSKQEQQIITRYFGYDASEVCITGLARWDELEDKSKDYNEILLMPTWRNWLDEIEENTFIESDYYKNYTELLHSDRLKKILKKNNLKLNFYIHPKFKDYIGTFESDSDLMRIIPYGEEPLNELMMRCKLLITDYSSVCWDVFYMNKPILFYQFDFEMYNRIHGSYIDMENNLFGDRSLTLDDLLDDLEKAIKKKFKLAYEYKLMRDNSFAYIDKKNSARIVQEIRKMRW